MTKKWEIIERLSDEELVLIANSLGRMYIGNVYKHTNGDLYTVKSITTVDINGKSYWGFVYDKSFRNVNHTRPMYEFLDGRFTLVHDTSKPLKL